VRFLIVAVVLVVLVLIFANPFEDSIRKENSERTDLFDAALVPGVDRLEIQASGAPPVVLVQQVDGWVVSSRNDFPADTTAVGAMLRSIRTSKSLGVASTNPDNRSKFQVDSNGVLVVASAGGTPVAHFTVGRIGQDFTTSYVRKDGADEVLIVRGMNRNLFARTQGYRDRTLFWFETTSVQMAGVTTPEEAWEVTRGDTAWVLTTGEGATEVAQAPVVEQILKALSTLSADGFLDDPPDTVDTGLASPDYIFSVRFMNGSEARVLVGKKNDRTQRYVSRPDRDAIYLMGDWRVTNAAKKAEEVVGS
jgi:hypothetical protein